MIIGCETWLDSSIRNSEVFPEGYNTQVLRKDRNNFGGGVLISAKDDIKLTEIKCETNCEVIYGQINTYQGAMVLGSFYRQLALVWIL